MSKDKKEAPKKSKNGNVDEAKPVIAELETAEEVADYVEDDSRDGVEEAATMRLEELKAAEGEAETVSTVEVSYEFLTSLHKAITEKVNADKKRRGMSQPNSVDLSLTIAKERLDNLLK